MTLWSPAEKILFWNPSHVWKAEKLEKTEIIVDCQLRTGDDNGDYKLILDFEVPKETIGNLLSIGSVTVNAGISLKGDKKWETIQKLITGGEKLVMGVYWNHRNSKVEVYVNKGEEFRGDWIPSELSWNPEMKLECKGDNLKNTGEATVGSGDGRFIFSGSVYGNGNRTLTNESDGINISVGLKECSYDGNNKTTATCTLKLIPKTKTLSRDRQ